jgi:uncharacterized membrane protein
MKAKARVLVGILAVLAVVVIDVAALHFHVFLPWRYGRLVLPLSLGGVVGTHFFGFRDRRRRRISRGG